MIGLKVLVARVREEANSIRAARKIREAREAAYNQQPDREEENEK